MFPRGGEIRTENGGCARAAGHSDGKRGTTRAAVILTRKETGREYLPARVNQ